MSQRVLISGYGSMGQRHAKILSKLVKKKNITILTNQKLSNFRTIKNLQSLNKIDPSYIVISNPTSTRLRAARNLPVTKCRTFNGRVDITSIVPRFFSRAIRLIVMAGIKKRYTKGIILKSERISD